MRADRDVSAHGTAVDYGQWVRNLADSLDDYDVGGDEM
jgi:hypothetical protein